jgi:hypothetical protein
LRTGTANFDEGELCEEAVANAVIEESTAASGKVAVTHFEGG